MTLGVDRTGYAEPFGEEKSAGEGEGGIAEAIAQKGQNIFLNSGIKSADN